MKGNTHKAQETAATTAASPAATGEDRGFWHIARWTLAVLACLWLAFCSAVGPIYRADGTIADFSIWNALIGVVMFCVYLTLVHALAMIGDRRSYGKQSSGKARGSGDNPQTYPDDPQSLVELAASASPTDASTTERPRAIPSVVHTIHDLSGKVGGFLRRAARPATIFITRHERTIIRHTDRTIRIFAMLIVGWAWCYVTLLSAFGADVFSQIREFTSFWEQTHGNPQPYLDGTLVVNTIMDVYPTAHYLWPADPTFLTNQHNILLTLLYGGMGYLSQSVTGSPDAGLIILSGLQFVFAAFCCAATANRFLNRPFVGISTRAPLSPAVAGQLPSERGTTMTRVTTSAATRVIVLALLLVNPIVIFSTISLTKSPLFAFAFVWWFGALYELYATSGKTTESTATTHPRRTTVVALALSTLVMLASAKYGLYIVFLQLVLALIADRKRWRTYAVALLIPLIAFQGMITALTATNTIIGGDPIESKGVQLQQIGRIAQRDPDSIPASAREKIEPIIDLDGAAKAYFPNDADRMKSSGSAEDKTVAYKWRTVTAKDMENFNSAWLEMVKASPVVAIDALLAKCYGYFDVFDVPYVSAIYYVNNGKVQKDTTIIKHWFHGWRDAVAWFANGWSHIPVIGWPVHGNFWTILTLVVGAVEVVRRRWRALAYHLPMLLLMGVMITAPANDFDRHMLPLVFCFAFLALWFRRDGRNISD
ncbi:hypothetical protein JS532_09535 [Bifidobacterium callimiconis]|uniref:Beta-carotene 15,15'-monooxygenase n=2 Tax=Bifidobacterium callimiconis TaxID=2306973 RepID=A0A430FDS7_9BIFI|nr:DUF6020 family protein [Bifidobacterium callimiconis]MBT1177795.1 hypothetical protein [Bifidobacterium callimiconis]RSX50979.1 hypothetical protein D2E23_1270 [Bifidobacterium callimiconis]